MASTKNRKKLTTEERIAQVEEQERRLREKKKALRARASSETRKRDTRSKIVFGAALAAELQEPSPDLEIPPGLYEWVVGTLRRRVLKRDREIAAELIAEIPAIAATVKKRKRASKAPVIKAEAVDDKPQQAKPDPDGTIPGGNFKAEAFLKGDVDKT